MLGEGLFLAYASYSGGAVGNFMSYLESMGAFTYILPFLLLFALIFGILTKVNIFENKGVNAVIALVVGLMSLQFNVVAVFFAEIFPRLGIGLSVILVLLIISGLFMNPKNKWLMKTVSVISVLIVIVVVATSFNNFAFLDSVWWNEWWATAAGFVVIAGILVAIIFGTGKSSDRHEESSLLQRALLGSNQN